MGRMCGEILLYYIVCSKNKQIVYVQVLITLHLSIAHQANHVIEQEV